MKGTHTQASNVSPPTQANNTTTQQQQAEHVYTIPQICRWSTMYGGTSRIPSNRNSPN